MKCGTKPYKHIGITCQSKVFFFLNWRKKYLLHLEISLHTFSLHIFCSISLRARWKDKEQIETICAHMFASRLTFSGAFILHLKSTLHAEKSFLANYCLLATVEMMRIICEFPVKWDLKYFQKSKHLPSTSFTWRTECV